MQRARIQIRRLLGTGTSASAGFDNDGVGDPDGALLTAAAHLQQAATQLDPLMQDEEETPELIDMAVSVSATVEVTRAAAAALNWHGDDEADTRRRADVGYSAAPLAFVASEALRAEAIAPLIPAGAPVPDVPRSFRWPIADLTVRLRTAGRIGPAGSPTDPGLAARDAADLVVTTYRLWTPRTPRREGGCDDTPRGDRRVCDDLGRALHGRPRGRRRLWLPRERATAATGTIGCGQLSSCLAMRSHIQDGQRRRVQLLRPRTYLE